MKKMIISLFIILLLVLNFNTVAQVAINKDGSAPGAEAILQVKGDNGGTPVEAMFIKSSNGYTGIGTTSPDAALHVAGSIKMTDGNQGVGRLLTSDSSGTAAWQNLGTVFGNELSGDPDFSCFSVCGSLGIGLSPTSMALSGDYAYVVDNLDLDLKAIDISNPESLLFRGSLGLGHGPSSVAVSGNYAYVVDDGSADLKVIDVSNPAGPVLSGSLGIGNGPTSVAVSGNHAYVVDDFSDDLKVIDVSNPASPVLSGSLGIGDSPRSVAVSGNYAYVVDNTFGELKVVDVSNPAGPVLSGSLIIGYDPKSVAVSGNYAYVIENNGDDLIVIDISNPAIPVLSGSLGIGPWPESVTVSGNYTYVVDSHSCDLKVIDVSNPASPVLSASLGIGNGPTSVALSGKYAYVVDNYSNDLKAIQLSCESSMNYNPLSGETSYSNILWHESGTDIYNGNDGNVGIGTASPDTRLHIKHPNLGDTAGIKLSQGSNNAVIYINSDGDVVLRKMSATDQLILDGGGNVGIGTSSPTEKLSVDGNILQTTGDHLATDRVRAIDGNGLELYDDGGNGLFVVDGGNVGIGTTSPDSLLHVNGGVKIEGKVDIDDGGQSVFLGSDAGANDDGSDNRNVAVGISALSANTSGNNNTACGRSALYSNTTGSQNTATGYHALYLDTTGSYNTASGYAALNYNTTGNSNTAVGHGALYHNQTGDFNTAVGHSAGQGSAALTNTTSIGYNTQPSGSNEVRLGNGDVTALFCMGATSVIGGSDWLVVNGSGQIGKSASSLRYKENVVDIGNAAWLFNLRPVNFNYKEDKQQSIQYGLIAEEVEKVNPEIVSYNGQGQVETVSYSQLIAPMLKVMQEQQVMIDKQQKQIDMLMEKLEQMTE